MKDRNVRYYRMAGFVIRVESDLPFAPDTYLPKFEAFEADGPGKDTVVLHHKFGLPPLDRDAMTLVTRQEPWAIYRRGTDWVYVCFNETPEGEVVYQTVFFDRDYTRATVFNASEEAFRRGGHQSLMLFPSDQIWLIQLLARRGGCLVHSSGVRWGEAGLLFVGHSEAGKSTMIKLLRPEVEILCDDRIAVMRAPAGIRIHGTWSHGELPDCSPADAPLRGLFFLEKDKNEFLEPIPGGRGVGKRMLPYIVRSLTHAGWWEEILPLAEALAREVPCYNLHFDREGRVRDLLAGYVAGLPG